MPFADIRGARIKYEVIGNTANNFGPWLALTPGGRRNYVEFIPLAE